MEVNYWGKVPRDEVMWVMGDAGRMEQYRRRRRRVVRCTVDLPPQSMRRGGVRCRREERRSDIEREGSGKVGVWVPERGSEMERERNRGRELRRKSEKVTEAKWTR